VASISAGISNYCARLSSGGVDCWGLDSNGQLGNGEPYALGDGSASPLQVVGVGDTGTLSGVASLTSDQVGYCALLLSGGVDCWGYGVYGNLGDGNFYLTGSLGSASPVEVVGPGGTGTLSGVTSLPSDGSGFCVGLSSGAAECWGEGSNGSLGGGTYANSATPVPVVEAVTPAITTDPLSQAVSVGSTLTFSVAASGTPAPTVLWQLSVDGGSTWLSLPEWGTTTVTTGTLTTFENGWEFRAVFNNGAGTATTNAATITVVPSTLVVLPSYGATLSGTQYLDATTSPGVTQVKYELTGGSLTDSLIATATPTIFGWVANWNTTAVPNGTYTLQSVASYADGRTGTNSGLPITVDNPPPTTAVGLPANGAILSGGQWLDASATPGVTQVQYELTGGTLNNAVVATATSTIVGWLAGWLTATVPNGTYTLQSVASYAGGVTGTSAPVMITVNN
jgi:hypothetical protein